MFEIAKSLCGWCIITTKETITKIGGKLDERALFWCSDDLYGKQLREAGLTHAMIPSCKVSHLRSQTLDSLPEDEYNRLTYKEYNRVKRLL